MLPNSRARKKTLVYRSLLICSERTWQKCFCHAPLCSRSVLDLLHAGGRSKRGCMSRANSYFLHFGGGLSTFNRKSRTARKKILTTNILTQISRYFNIRQFISFHNPHRTIYSPRKSAWAARPQTNTAAHSFSRDCFPVQTRALKSPEKEKEC